MRVLRTDKKNSSEVYRLIDFTKGEFSSVDRDEMIGYNLIPLLQSESFLSRLPAYRMRYNIENVIRALDK
jgi:hypothetical protein